MGQQAALDKKAVDLIHGFHRGDSQCGGPDGLGREPFLQCGDNQAVASITDIQKALFEGAFSFAPGGTEEVCGAQSCQGVTQNGDGRGMLRAVVDDPSSPLLCAA